MARPGQQRFTPPSSDGLLERATSPALSASSRTTTSLPTDLSDVSSISDGDYEVVEPPEDDDEGLGQLARHTVHPYDSDAEDDQEGGRFPYGRRAALSDRDMGSSSHLLDSEASSIVLVPKDGVDTDSLAGSHDDASAAAGQSLLKSSQSGTDITAIQGASTFLQASRSSMDTINRDLAETAEWTGDSCSSSQLRFPDPLESMHGDELELGDVSPAREQADAVEEVQDKSPREAVEATTDQTTTETDVSQEGKGADEVVAASEKRDYSVQDILEYLQELFSSSPRLSNLNLMRHGWRVGVAVLAIAMASSTYRHWLPSTSMGPAMPRHAAPTLLTASMSSKSLVQPQAAAASSFAPVQKPFDSTRASKAVAVTTKATKDVGASRPSALGKLATLPNKTFTAAEKGTRELSTYLVGSSANAANWISCDFLTKIHPGMDMRNLSNDVMKKKAQRQLQKSSRNAKALMVAMQKDVAVFATGANTRYQVDVKPHGVAIRRAAQHRLNRSKELLHMFSSPKKQPWYSPVAMMLYRWTNALLATLQKPWSAWVSLIRREFTRYQREFWAEQVRINADLTEGWNRAAKMTAKSSREAQKLWLTAQQQARGTMRLTHRKAREIAQTLCDGECSKRGQRQVARGMRELETLRRRYRVLMRQAEKQAARHEKRAAAQAKRAAGNTLKAMSKMQDALQDTLEDAKQSLRKSSVQAGRARVKLSKAASTFPFCSSLKRGKASRACDAAREAFQGSAQHSKRHARKAHAGRAQ